MEFDVVSQNQFILILNGPSCGGKSSVAEAIQSQYKGIFNARIDKIKWLISDYSSGRYKPILYDMMFNMIEIALKNGLSVVREGMINQTEKLDELAAKYNVKQVHANICAPKDILQSRFLQRIEAQKQGAKIANVDPIRFEKIYEYYKETKIQTPLEFDSSIKSPEEIASELISHLRTILN